MARFRFLFTPPYRVAAVPFGVTPRTAMVRVEDGEFEVRFGPWRLLTPLDNVVGSEPTGPYSFPKTAGPAHLSVADKGLTCATNGRRGLCIRFRDPVPCIDPFGRIRHPAVTVTIDRIEDLQRLLDPDTHGLERERVEGRSERVAVEAPHAYLARFLRRPADIARAVRRHLATLGNVSRTYTVTGDPPPTQHETTDPEDLQPITAGTGPVLQRTYRVHIADTRVTPEELIDRLAEHLDDSSGTGLADFVEQRTTDRAAGVGSEYRLRMPGPWNPGVRIIERTPTSIRLATLTGHMEAGQLEVRSRRAGGDPPDEHRTVFEVHSVARAGSHGFSLLYNRLRIAREMQLHMWVDFCGNVCTHLAEGRLDGKIELVTVEHRR